MLGTGSVRRNRKGARTLRAPCRPPTTGLAAYAKAHSNVSLLNGNLSSALAIPPYGPHPVGRNSRKGASSADWHHPSFIAPLRRIPPTIRCPRRAYRYLLRGRPFKIRLQRHEDWCRSPAGNDAVIEGQRQWQDAVHRWGVIVRDDARIDAAGTDDRNLRRHHDEVCKSSADHAEIGQ